MNCVNSLSPREIQRHVKISIFRQNDCEVQLSFQLFLHATLSTTTTRAFVSITLLQTANCNSEIHSNSFFFLFRCKSLLISVNLILIGLLAMTASDFLHFIENSTHRVLTSNKQLNNFYKWILPKIEELVKSYILYVAATSDC